MSDFLASNDSGVLRSELEGEGIWTRKPPSIGDWIDGIAYFVTAEYLGG